MSSIFSEQIEGEKIKSVTYLLLQTWTHQTILSTQFVSEALQYTSQKTPPPYHFWNSVLHAQYRAAKDTSPASWHLNCADSPVSWRNDHSSSPRSPWDLQCHSLGCTGTTDLQFYPPESKWWYGSSYYIAQWSEMKRRILIGCLWDQNFKINGTLRMTTHKIIFSCFFKVLQKRGFF